MMERIKMLVALHKPYWLPQDDVYAPIRVGGAAIPGLEAALGDDQGNNISNKNKYYCEMTALYWAWKNLDADYVGLVHYRRYFAGKRPLAGKFARIATRAEIEAALQKAPVILPKPRNYWIETTYSQYAHAHHAEDLDAVRAILEKQYPAYLAAFDRVMCRTKGHRFNMMVMRRDYFERYCEWMFDVLERAEEQIDWHTYSAYDQRVFGFLAERLMDVWIETNEVPYTEMPVVFLESQHWLKKGTAFLRRKFRGRP